MQNSSGGHDPFGGDPFSWTPPLKASGATLNPTAERPAISSPDADIFDLFGPSHGAPQPQLVPNLVSNGTDAQAGAASGSSNAPMSMPDPFGIAFNSRAGDAHILITQTKRGTHPDVCYVHVTEDTSKQRTLQQLTYRGCLQTA